MRVLITGATGFIGGRLLEHLDDVVVLSRDPVRARQTLGAGPAIHRWDPMEGPPPREALEGVEGVIHLAGEPINGRWTPEKKRRIVESRTTGTRHLVAALLDAEVPPKVLVSASAVGYYGDRGEEEITESSDAGDGFVARVCQAWEGEAVRAAKGGIRVVAVRTGLVLGEEGGAMGKLIPLFKFGLGGRLGNGRQYWPWIPAEDLVGIMRHALEDDDLSGPVNAVAPAPVQNRFFTRVLGRVLGRPTLLPAPAFALRLVLGEFASELLDSRRVQPERLREAGYRFRYPDLVEALHEVTGNSILLAGRSSER